MWLDDMGELECCEWEWCVGQMWYFVFQVRLGRTSGVFIYLFLWKLRYTISVKKKNHSQCPSFTSLPLCNKEDWLSGTFSTGPVMNEDVCEEEEEKKMIELIKPKTVKVCVCVGGCIGLHRLEKLYNKSSQTYIDTQSKKKKSSYFVWIKVGYVDVFTQILLTYKGNWCKLVNVHMSYRHCVRNHLNLCCISIEMWTCQLKIMCKL